MGSGKQTWFGGFGGWFSLMTGIKVGPYFKEHSVLYSNNELWNTTLKTNEILFGN